MNKTFCFAISSPVASGFVKRRLGFTAALLNRRELLEIARENFVRSQAILKTLQVCLQLRRTLLRQRVHHPVLIALYLHHGALAQIAEVLGNFHLRLAQDRLEMADAERRLRQQIQNPQPGAIAETLIDLDEVHRRQQQAAAVPQQSFAAASPAVRRSCARHCVRRLPRTTSRCSPAGVTSKTGYCATAQQSYSTSISS